MVMLCYKRSFEANEVEVGGRHFDGPPASRSDRKGRAESSASARQKRGPARGFRSGQQQDDVWSPAGNQRRGRRNDDRSGERFRDAAHCDVGKSVLSHCADTALNYCLILYILCIYCIWACVWV